MATDSWKRGVLWGRKVTLGDARRVMRQATAYVVAAGIPFRAINSGNCEDWAEYVQSRLPGATAYWLDQHNEWLSHCMVRFRGRFYDAENLDGLTDWRQLEYAQRVLREVGE